MVESKKTQAVILIMLILCGLAMLRSVVAGVNQMIVSDAIYVYQMDCIRDDKSPVINHSDKESFTDTYLRLWDWGHKRILDEYDYYVIEPYIGEDVEEWEAGEKCGKD